MNIQNFKRLLENKSTKTGLENTTLLALNDTDFLAEYDDLAYLRYVNNQYPNVLGSGNSSNNHYMPVLIDITNTYRSYLYEKKYKFESAKQQIADFKNNLEKEKNAIQGSLETIREEIEIKKTEYGERLAIINQDFDNAQKDIEYIKSISDGLSGIDALQAYAKVFKERANKYNTDAGKWRSGLYISYFVGAIAVILLFVFDIVDLTKFIADDIAFNTYALVLSIKIIIALGVVQVIRFFSRNYNANKHLEHQSLHKCDVLRALMGVHELIKDETIKNDLLKNGILVAFQTTESGYISRSQGAGSDSDNGLSIINKLISK